MRITCLAENTSNNNELLCEHGLSLYIETKKHKILFDMGQSGLFADNAKKMNIDLQNVDIAILSHGHYDHGGGLPYFFEQNKKVPVYISRYAFENHYNAVGKYIGLDQKLSLNSRYVFTDDICKLDEGLTLYSCNGYDRKFDVGTFGMTYSTDGKILPEDFRHEQYLLIEEDGKKVLVSGCSHKGIIDITNWFKPDVLVGGFHFSKFPLDKNLQGYANLMSGFNTVYYTCHCTGVEQYEFMKKSIKRLNYLSTGDSIQL